MLIFTLRVFSLAGVYENETLTTVLNRNIHRYGSCLPVNKNKKTDQSRKLTKFGELLECLKPKGNFDGAAVDRLSRWLFPSVFIVINVIYWWYFMAMYGTVKGKGSN